MPSRLSSLLVRDGLVGVKRMEKAFQRQVIYGGSLDTILLEMGLVPEERLTQYLALASGLPPAGKGEGAHVDPAAAAIVEVAVAEKYRAVPVAIVDGDGLRLLVCAPLEITELEDLADLLDRPLQPLITPEYRWYLAYSAAYALDPPARFTTLARSLDVDATTAPVGRARSVIVELPGVAPVPEDAPTARLSARAVTQDPEPTPPPLEAPPLMPDAGRHKASTLMGNRPYRAATEPGAPATIQPARPIAGRTQTVQGVGSSPVIVSHGDDAVVVDVPLPAHTSGPIAIPTDRASRSSMPLPAPDITPPPPAEPVEPPPTTIQPKPSRTSTEEDTKPEWLAPRTESGPQLVAIAMPRGTTPIGSARPAAIKIPKRAETVPPINVAGRDSPLSILQARETLATAEDRDSVFLTLLRAARARARWAGLLTVQGGAAIGRVALAEPGMDTQQITTILIPLDAVSAFRTVVGGQQPHIGPLVTGDAGIDGMLQRIGGDPAGPNHGIPPSALIMPIVLRERVIALMVAHRAHNDIRIVDVAELLPLAGVASDAIGRLIVKHKAAGYRAPPSGVGVVQAAEFESEVDTKRIVIGVPAGAEAVPAVAAAQPDSGAWAVPAPTERVSMPTITIEPPEASEPEISVTETAAAAVAAVRHVSIDAILDEIEQAREYSAGEAISEAVERASETLGALVRRFPGKLRVDRFSVAGRPLRAAQYGGLLELVVGLGSVAGELLIEKMSSPQRDTRFYATVCAAELRPRNAVFGLVERLFDQDFGVRAMALEALSGYPMNDLAHALVRVRRAIHSQDPEVVGAATAAVVELGDVDAIADLIGAVERRDRGGEHARRALVTLTAEDFGASERKWRKWHEGSRRRHRIEWLIDGLGHKLDPVREGAINDLRRLTGEYFGYHYDLPRKEREVSAARWAAWWRETGQRRFEQREDERLRPTALLPARREP